MTLAGQLVELQIMPGVMPSTDATSSDIPCWASTYHVRFDSTTGRLRKIGGWSHQTFDYNVTVDGTIRTVYSATINQQVTTILGTNTSLYALLGSSLSNITPLDITPIDAPDSLATHYATLASNPISTTSGSNVITIADTEAGLFQTGDVYTLSGATTTNGVPNTEINARHIIRTIGVNVLTVQVGTNATSTGSGGGASVVRSSGLITLTQMAHGLSENERIGVAGVATLAASSATVGAPGTGYVPGDIIKVAGGDFESPATFTLSTTKVVSATVAAGGTGGSSGTQTVTGTTGSGTKFQASVTVSGGGSITAVLSISLAGSYASNPSILTNEPVTGASLTGAALNVIMGVNTITLLDAGIYYTPPINNAATTCPHGTGATLDVTYSGIDNVGGIPNTDIDIEFNIRNVLTDSFDFMTEGTATSSVSGAGGSDIVYFLSIPAGNLDQGIGQGYGAGKYGVGLYGTALLSEFGEKYPQIWFCDRYGDNIVTTPGNQSGVYTWNGNTTEAPTLIPNAPTDINYAFVQDNILVTFGHELENQIFSSDQGDYTQWTASSNNQVFQLTLVGAGRLISHVPLNGYSLIFTSTQTYTFQYIGLLSGIWQIQILDSAIGILAPMARISVNGYAYWMGQDNFYMFRGGRVEIIPSNIGLQSSILRYVFDDLNYSQRYKIFAWYNENYDEIWWHYPSSESNECDRIARFNRTQQFWTADQMDRTAGEYPVQNLSNPRLADVGTLYLHESGNDDDGAPMVFSATTKKFLAGRDTIILGQIVPDSQMTGTIALTVGSYNYPQSAVAMNLNTYSITSTTERVPMQINGRYEDYTISGAELGQSFLMGQWMLEPQKSSRAP